MAAMAISQSHYDKSHYSPARSIIPLTCEHSPDPELCKQSNVWELKDLNHPLHWDEEQKAYEKWLDKAREEADDSPKLISPSSNHCLPSLEDISKEEKNLYPFTFYEISPPERHLPIVGPSNMPGTFEPKDSWSLFLDPKTIILGCCYYYLLDSFLESLS
jgi:hypothetical protein